MSRGKHLRRRGPGPLELIEEAVHVLRLCPWAVLGVYYLGSLPFLLGLLYFWADMSRGSTAYEHCAPAAFAVAVLFLWMKTWQAMFARQLKAQITGRPARTISLPGFLRTALNQTILQPSALFLLPLSLLIVLPFGWCYAFYQSVTAFGAEDGAGAKQVFQRAIRGAQFWPRQNHLLLGALLLFGLVVFLDVGIGLATVPSLMKTLFGIETAFTRSSWGFFNTTFLATVGALTYLCLDPVIKAVYLLRCFYGESLHTGEDLRAELKQYVPDAGTAVMVLLMIIPHFQGLAEPRCGAIHDTLAFTASLPGGNEENGSAHPESLRAFASSPRDAGGGRGLRRGEFSVPPLPGPLLHQMEEREFLRLRLRQTAVLVDPTPREIPNTELRTPSPGISPPDLDRSIEEVLGRREFNWRLPREKPAGDGNQQGLFAAFMDGLIETLRSWAKAIGSAVKAVVRWIAEVVDWVRESIFGKREGAQGRGSEGTDWMVALQGLIFVLLVLVACAVAILFYRTWWRRARKEIASKAAASVPDVADENVIASQLPEDDWLRLARELMGQGELRLALRALYLAGLAHLAQRELIRVAKFKSNRDYEQELWRRARALPELQAAFAENVGIFDRVWYGLHEVTQERLQRFQVNLEKIRAH
jgi:hypothetical protein